MKKYRNPALLVLTAMIWGVAFVAQTEGGDVVGPFTFNCTRSVLGSLVLLPVIRLLDSLGLSVKKPETREDRLSLLRGGICCGLCLAFASCFQQLGLYYGTAAGKAGFLTACYIVIVPVLGLFVKKKCGWNVWAAIVVAVVGLYLLCMNGSLSVQMSDMLVIVCSFLYSLHIITIDHFVVKNDPVRMSCIQFATAAVISFFPMVVTEIHPLSGGFSAWLGAFASTGAWVSILYAGICSSGIAYTLQIVGQQNMNPTVASLIMSLESVFSVLAGWLILGQHLTARELLGCAVVFAAIVLAQLPEKMEKKAA